MMTTRIFFLAMMVLLLASCRGSIIRNVAEAGIETALDAPQPTPTITR